MQQTLSRAISFQGIGAHSGEVANVTIKPAAVDTGIVFKRVDLGADNIIEASFKNVSNTLLCTVISNEAGAKVSTIEHLMSAFWGCGIDNAIVEIDSDEVPIMDGSSAPFVSMIQQIGVKSQNKFRKILKIENKVEFEHEGKKISIEPSDYFEVEMSLKYEDQCIGEQEYSFSEPNISYGHEVSRARTFGFERDLLRLREMGLAKGSSLENAVGFNDNGVMNPEGLRYNNECIRHKVLDCIGDLYLSAHRIVGKVKGVKAGHMMNIALLKELFKDAKNYIIIEESGYIGSSKKVAATA